MSILLNEQQVDATYKADEWWNNSNEQVFEISGAAGTGKTFLVRYLIERFELDLDEVLFVAYMGKAAMALARNGLPAKTIHSAIYNYQKVLDKVDGKIQLTPSGKPKTKFIFTLKEKIPKNIRLIVVDEAGMVNEQIAKDLKSFGVPIIALGDLNQLPPVFGKSGFLNDPDVILTQIMRQAEGNPIIYLSQQVLKDEPLKIGVYKNSSVISSDDLDEYKFKNADIVLTGTNRLRYNINNMFREHIYKGLKLDRPNVGEKIICRKNNWNRQVLENIFLTNGMSGIVEYVDAQSFNGKQLKIDFKPDFLNRSFKNVTIDYERLFSSPSTEINAYNYNRDIFEFAYAITVHLSQGSQYPNVLFLKEDIGLSKEDRKKHAYTAITRASESITIAI